MQSGPVVSVNMPKDRMTNLHQGYVRSYCCFYFTITGFNFGFVGFMIEENADDAIKIMNMIKLSGKPIKTNNVSVDEKNMDVDNLDLEVDEKLLYDTFSAFGVILQVPNVCEKWSF